jgi:NAD(P)-dependent dehydrogenase (short-subunit alcohol dehydrogenase family)
MAPKTIIVLGAGPGIGYSVAKKFKAEGYEVAVGSRKPDADKAKAEGFLPITVDLTDLQSVEAAFALVNEKFGAPNVVVYNGISP